MVDGEQPFSVFDVSAALREQGWLVPAYTFPKNREDIAALRIVVRNGFTHDLADLLLDDLHAVIAGSVRTAAGSGRKRTESAIMAGSRLSVCARS